MRVIGVLDLMAGRAVHARHGRREEYRPIERVGALPLAAGDALAVARTYCNVFGIEELYVADLDAISSGQPQDALVRALADLAPLWLDAGVSSLDTARRAAGTGSNRIIVGLETLRSFEALGEICGALGRDRVAFSLDLRDGRPVCRLQHDVEREPAEALAAGAAALGAGAIIVLDLARVGANAGIDLDLFRRLRKAAPGVLLLAGGGVRGPDDLATLAAAGGDGALVATALLEGRLTRGDVATARAVTGPRSG
jgi:phosphoribosylformimino-5-aminoimidazole carboxamide ribotide isomerase